MNRTNIELTHFCARFHKIRETLRELGAKKETVKIQTDHFFNIPNKNGRLKLRRENNEQFLVYYERPDFSKTSGATSRINLSARPIPLAYARGIWRAEPRESFLVMDGATAPSVYSRPFIPEADPRGILGCSPIKLYYIKDQEGGLFDFLKETLGVRAVVQKQREVWRKENTVFHIDHVKGGGGIFEIELQKKGRVTALDRRLFENYRNKLLPHLGKVIKGSNVDLVSMQKKLSPDRN